LRYIITTGIAFFAAAKAILHSAKALPSVTLGKKALGKDFAECQKTLGKLRIEKIKKNSKTFFKF
jgi:hypothetical protein